MRAVVALVIRSGLGADYWLDHADPRELDTALTLLAEEGEADGSSSRGGVVYGG